MGTKRCRFPAPAVVRLPLADVHKRALEKLVKESKPTPEQIADAEARILQAEADGDFVDVKKELTAGESRRIYTDLISTFEAGKPAQLDPQQVGFTKIVAYVIGWSFVDAAGVPVPFSVTALQNVDMDSYREIESAVDWHDAQVDEARSILKKTNPGETTRPQTSTSHAG